MSVQTANKYYKSLRFNHFESGGTCEQRILVLRVRFDSFLEEAIEFKDNEKDFYVEKLQSLYIQFPNKFSQKEKDEFDVLRKFLNSVQHSKVGDVTEKDYILSLKRLCTLIGKTTGEDIPEDLQQLWNEKSSKGTMTQGKKSPKHIGHEMVQQTSDPQNDDTNKKSKRGIIPVSILLDTNNIATSEKSTTAFNKLLHNFIENLYSYNLPIKFTLSLLEKNGVKSVSPFTGAKKFAPFDKLGENMMEYAIEELINNLSVKEDEKCVPTTKGVCAMLLGSKTTCLLPSEKKFAEFVEKNRITVFPIGIDSLIDKKKFNAFYSKREAIIMTEGKFPEFFSWLIECIKKITCES